MRPDWGEIRATLRHDPNNPAALQAAGCYYLQAGQFKNAKELLAQAAAASPHLVPDILLSYEARIGEEKDQSGPRLSLAGFLLSAGELDAAVLELEELLEANPKEVEAYNLLGKIYNRQGRTDEAIAVLEQALQEGIKDVALIEILAQAYLEKGRLNEAIKFYREMLDYRPGDKQLWRTLGELYTRQEDYDQAARCYQAMFSDDPEVGREVTQRLEELLKKLEGNIFIREVLAEVYVRSLKPEQAIAKLSEIARLDREKLDEVIVRLRAILRSYPGHPAAQLALAEAIRRQGNLSEAIELYHELAKNKPEFLGQALAGYREILETFPDQALARTYLAEALITECQVDESLVELEKMVRIDPQTAEIAIRKCRELLHSQPQLLPAHLVLGRAYLIKGDLQRALLEAESIIALDKKQSAAHLLLGEVYLQLKQEPKAVASLRQALQIDPFNPAIQALFKTAKEQEARTAVDLLKQRITEDPWKVSLHFDLAKLYLPLDQREEAIREVQLTLKDQARVPAACNLLGCLYRGEGRFDLAAAQFARGLEAAPAELFLNLQTNLGSVFEAGGEVKKALKCYERVLQEDIDFADLQKKVKYLKATNLASLRNKTLLLAITRPGGQELMALWGRESRSGRISKNEEMSVSFGQNYSLAGFDYFMKGMYKAALDEFGLAVQLDARFAAGLNNLAAALAREGRLSEAKGKLEEAVQLEPDSVIFHNNLGVVLLLLGQAAAARTVLERAYQLDAELPAVSLNLGDQYYADKMLAKAVPLYQKISRYDALTEAAERRLRYLIP